MKWCVLREPIHDHFARRELGVICDIIHLTTDSHLRVPAIDHCLKVGVVVRPKSTILLRGICDVLRPLLPRQVQVVLERLLGGRAELREASDVDGLVEDFAVVNAPVTIWIAFFLSTRNPLRKHVEVGGWPLHVARHVALLPHWDGHRPEDSIGVHAHVFELAQVQIEPFHVGNVLFAEQASNVAIKGGLWARRAAGAPR
mmetsp:Transcript_25310/g.66196  ORF Transcript_25310/g.66196 Transcript_25310/m.66196 type:complete len:200 (-) Transcript_25310:215-814(-)